MTKITSQPMSARLDVLSVTVQEIARALPPAQAVQVGDGIRMRVADLAVRLTPAADEALTGELAPLLAALGSPAQVTAAATRLC